MHWIRFIIIAFISFITALAVVVAFFVCTPQGVSMLIAHLSSRLLGPNSVRLERVEGSILRGMRVFNVEVAHPWVLPEGTLVRIQELGLRATQLNIEGLSAIIVNARVLSDKADPVVANGALRGSNYDVNVFSRSLDLETLRKVIRHFRNPPLLKGDLKDIDLVLSGTFSRPVLKGAFTVAHVPQNGFVMQQAPMKCDLYFTRMGGLWSTYGRLFIQEGWIRGPHSLMRLKESWLTFTGDPRDPELDVHAVSTIKRVRIQITVRGTRKDPHVSLVSDPALPQEQLMLMLTTGKRWDSLNSLSGGRTMTPEVAGDFVDYFFFGGSGQRVAQFFGLSGISYKFDQTSQGVTLNKDLGDQLGVGYGVKVTTSPADHQKSVTQTMDGQYRVNDHVTVDAQKEILPPEAAQGSLDVRRVPDDRILLKYKRSF